MFFKPKPKTGPINLPNESSEDLLNRDRNTDLEEPVTPSSTPSLPSSVPFDLALAKVSLFVEVAGYTGLCIASDAVTFTAFTMMGSFGSGFGPAVSSVALALYLQRGGVESGKLFGAMSVVQSLWYVSFTTVLSPVLVIDARAAHKSSAPLSSEQLI